MLPIRRDFRFELPADRIHDWHPDGEHITQFFNTLSLFFPVGERFFINAVRNYREQITDPELKEAVKAFIGQEAMHGREHEEYNDLADAGGLPVKQMESTVARLLETLKQRLPQSFQLGATVALEHYTAILADILLREPAVLGDAEPRFKAVWNWHALEETEHKAVAYDVFRTVVGEDARAYAIRASSMLVATGLFWSLVYSYHYRIMKSRGKHRDLRGWWSVFKFQWVNPGGLRRNVRPWLDYFKPGFHPWQHDNREFLSRMEALAKEYETPPTPMKAA
jgi:predicted metal-dependent hydrolase